MVLSTAPVAGTAFLASWFSSGSYGGTDTATYDVAAGIASLTDFTSHASNNGIDGYRYFTAGSGTVGDQANASNPNQDTYSWVVNFAQTGSYDGTQDIDVTYAAGVPSSYTGTVETTWNTDGITQSTSTLTEASGSVTLATARAIAETDVDRISVGALTHSAPALDIALDYVS